MTAAAAATLTPATTGALRVETVESVEGLMALEPEWTALLDRAEVRHPFLTLEWLLTWWESFGRGRQLRVVVVRDAGGLVAVAPLMLGRRRFMGLPLRCLESLANDHTPRFDVVVAGRVEEVWDALWAHLLSRRNEWDLLRLCQLPREAPSRGQIERRAAADEFLVGEWAADESPFIRLTGSWGEYCRRGRSKHFANLRNRTRRLCRLGPLVHEVISLQHEAPDGLADGLRIEAAGWKGQAGTALVSRPETRQFYSSFAERAAERGWLRLAFLKVGGQRIAFAYCLDYGGRRFVVKTGYDPEWATYSPFHLLCSMELQEAFGHGLVEFDLLGGREPWKTEWTGDARAHVWLFVLAPGPFTRLLHGLKFGWLPRLQRRRSYRALRDIVARRRWAKGK